jgi:hypothetical protein
MRPTRSASAPSQAEAGDATTPAAHKTVPASSRSFYARLANSIRNGTPASPGFDAVKRRRLIDAIVRASTTGQKQLFDDG